MVDKELQPQPVYSHNVDQGETKPGKRMRQKFSGAVRRALRSQNMTSEDAACMVDPSRVSLDLTQPTLPTMEYIKPELSQEEYVYSPSIIEEQVEDTTKRYFVLREDVDKFFRTLETVRDNPPKTAAEILALPQNERTNVITELHEVRLLLGVTSFNEIQDVLNENPEERAKRSEQANRKLATEHGIHGDLKDIENTISEYGLMANRVIQTLLEKELSEETSGLEVSNDVESCNDPVDLTLITFDDSYAPQVRFEAKRKLELMKLVAKVHTREKQHNFVDQQSDLDSFLTNHVYTQEGKKGQLKQDYFLATFDEKNGGCTHVEVLDSDEYDVDLKNKTYQKKPQKNASDFKPSNGIAHVFEQNEESDIHSIHTNQKVKKIPRRTFTYNGVKIPVYSKNPLKEVERKILKTIRKGEEEPDVAIDDDVRMMCVFNNAEDARKFGVHLLKCADEIGSRLDIGPVEDTLEGGERTEKAGGIQNGGSKDIHWIKFDMDFALPGKQPLSAEVQLFTNASWFDYDYKPGVAHEEFAVKRFFGKDDEKGAADLLFPYKFYKTDMKIAREDKLVHVREELDRHASGLV